MNIIKIFRSRSPFYAYSMREKQRQIEERRVIYVGRIEEGMTSAKLRKRFSIFGPIIDISLHFREYGWVVVIIIIFFSKKVFQVFIEIKINIEFLVIIMDLLRTRTRQMHMMPLNMATMIHHCHDTICVSEVVEDFAKKNMLIWVI